MTGSVVFVTPDKLGGALTIVRAMAGACPPGGPAVRVVLTDNRNDPEARGSRSAPVVETRVPHQLPRENLYAVLRRLRAAVGPGPGILVSNDWLELAMEHPYPTGRAVVQILHGDHAYYYDLAIRHQGVIDGFIAYSRAMAVRLAEHLPHRAADIRHLPYGVTLPAHRRQPGSGPLRLVFAGRLEHGQKGVLDLPAIDAVLAARGVDVTWTIIGAGPHEAALRDAWAGRPVTWVGALDREALLARLPSFDVLVLPTRVEGFPVALVEAMAAGLVPVVSDVASGVPEIVTHGVTGLQAGVGDVHGFARAIEDLATNRPAFEQMSAAAAAAVRGRFDPACAARAYFGAFADFAGRARPARRPEAAPYGSRLDRPWLPNALVRGVRTWRDRV